MPEIALNEVDENQILREVFDGSEIDVKTELTDRQIENLNKVLTLANVTGSEILHAHAIKFMRLQKSRNRQSMGEFIQGLYGAHGGAEKDRREGFFKRLLG